MSKSSLLKNARNYAEYLRKKERGPVKAFFHITKNENVPAIEQQGLLTNHPNANVNSAAHPFRKHGTDTGGVWVTTEPTAFPVYGTTIGGKHGNSAARADALSTIKIEVPLPELAKMKAVQDPYGKNILRKGDDPRAVQKFPTWAGIDVPTTVLLNDVKPQWLKNIGYVEEAPSMYDVATMPEINDLAGSWGIYPDNEDFKQLRFLSKGDLRDYSGYTGHRHGTGSYEKSPQRFVNEYVDKNQPITERLPEFPKPEPLEYTARRQGASSGPNYVRNGIGIVPAPNEVNRYSADFIPAYKWTEDYRDYVKPGQSILSGEHRFEFAPGAISRGISGIPSKVEFTKAIYDRNFNWNQYDRLIAEGETPSTAAHAAAPDYVLDWDNITYKPGRGYGPKHVVVNNLNEGAISRGISTTGEINARMDKINRRKAANMIRRKKLESSEILSRKLGRQPTAEEVDAWTRAGIWNAIESGDMENVPSGLGTWADRTNWDIVERLTDELGGD